MRKPSVLAAAILAPALLLSACTAGSLGTQSTAGASGEGVSIRFLIPSGEDSVALANAVVKGFNVANPTIKVNVETRPGGTEGDNLVKTKLATGDMAEVFQYNSGSLLAQINPDKNLVDVTAEKWTADLDANFKSTVTVNQKVYGSPWGTFSGGGVLYNKKVYDSLGLKVPLTWSEFMANSEKIKAAGKTAVIGSFADTWSSQLLVLGDFHNVAAVDPQWAEKYTKNQAHFSEEPAIRGFQHLEAVSKASFMNKDFNATKYEDALKLLASGEGVQYPMLTFAIPALAAISKDTTTDIGFFGLPGDDAAKNGATVWSPSANYIPQTATGAKLDAAKKFVAFWGSAEGCKAQLDAAPATGPWAVKTCTLPDSVPQIVKDLKTYVDSGKSTPALEFSSPVKGPSLEQITIEVGSGFKSALEGAKLYDEDVKKQAQQLGLPGW